MIQILDLHKYVVKRKNILQNLHQMPKRVYIYTLHDYNIEDKPI